MERFKSKSDPKFICELKFTEALQYSYNALVQISKSLKKSLFL